MGHFFIACRPIPLHFCQIVDLLTDCVINLWTNQRQPWGRFSNELGRGGMKALFDHVFLRLGGICVDVELGRRVLFKTFIFAVILTELERGSFALCVEFKVMKCAHYITSFYLTCHFWLEDYRCGICVQTLGCTAGCQGLYTSLKHVETIAV